MKTTINRTKWGIVALLPFLFAHITVAHAVDYIPTDFTREKKFENMPTEHHRTDLWAQDFQRFIQQQQHHRSECNFKRKDSSCNNNRLATIGALALVAVVAIPTIMHGIMTMIPETPRKGTNVQGITSTNQGAQTHLIIPPKTRIPGLSHHSCVYTS